MDNTPNIPLLEWLNSEVDGKKTFLIAAVSLVVWAILWHLIIRKLLWKSKPGSIWQDFAELPTFGGYGILLFFAFLIVLFIISVQASFIYGIRLLIPLALFWLIVISFLVVIIRKILK